MTKVTEELRRKWQSQRIDAPSSQCDRISVMTNQITNHEEIRDTLIQVFDGTALPVGYQKPWCWLVGPYGR